MTNIENFFIRCNNPSNWRKPIVMKWAKSAGMNKSIKIIDSKIGELLNKNARGKLKQWLLSDDMDFNAITSERYIIDYLKKK